MLLGVACRYLVAADHSGRRRHREDRSAAGCRKAIARVEVAEGVATNATDTQVSECGRDGPADGTHVACSRASEGIAIHRLIKRRTGIAITDRALSDSAIARLRSTIAVKRAVAPFAPGAHLACDIRRACLGIAGL